MRWILCLGILMVSFQALATVTSGSADCPVEFEGRIKTIVEPVGAVHSLSVNKVIFENQRSLKGEPGEQVDLEVLQNGPFSLALGKDYRVIMREGKLCWIEEL